MDKVGVSNKIYRFTIGRIPVVKPNLDPNPLHFSINLIQRPIEYGTIINEFCHFGCQTSGNFHEQCTGVIRCQVLIESCPEKVTYSMRKAV